MRVLIIDDAEVTRSFLKDSIKQAGLEFVGEAGDGVEGFQKYKELNPDLVIMDIVMPNMNGLECLKEILTYNKNAKVLICSALQHEAMIYQAVKTGAIDYVIKPFDEEALAEKLKNITIQFKE